MPVPQAAAPPEDVALKVREPEVRVVVTPLSISGVREMLIRSAAWAVLSHPIQQRANSPLRLGGGWTTVWARGWVKSVGSACSS